MSEFTIEFTNKYLPNKDIPFYSNLKELFISKKILDISIHCPNVIRCLEDIFMNQGQKIDKVARNNNSNSAVRTAISYESKAIDNCLGIKSDDEASRKKVLDTLRIAALYHDIGKLIRSANHPRLGVNILRNINDKERTKMVEGLVIKGEDKASQSNEHRFSLLCSIVEHHDKFGVVSTGEASLTIFSDILYFRSDEKAIAGIKKNITSVMILNLADIAAVCTADEDTQKKASELISGILEESSTNQINDYKQLSKIWNENDSYMGLTIDKVTNILDDWRELIKAIEDKDVLGNRTKLREYLIHQDQNPDRTIKRIIRLIKESCCTTGCESLLKCISETDIESTLVSFFGSHQFQDFCIKFAYIAKMDYGLKFFKGIVCACVRNKTKSKSVEKDGWQKLGKNEKEKLDKLSLEDLQDIVKKVSKIFIQVISGIIARYNSMFELKIECAYRFGLQMRTLTEDNNVREQIISYLCSIENMDHVALTWIADEVTFWSMD